MFINTQRTSELNSGTYSVGRTSDNVNDGNSVEEGLASNDIPEGIDSRSRYSTNQHEPNALWLDIKLHQILQVFGSFETLLSFLCGPVSLSFSGKASQPTGIDGGDSGRVRKGQTQNFESSSHRIGSAS